MKDIINFINEASKISGSYDINDEKYIYFEIDNNSYFKNEGGNYGNISSSIKFKLGYGYVGDVNKPILFNANVSCSYRFIKFTYSDKWDGKLIINNKNIDNYDPTELVDIVEEVTGKHAKKMSLTGNKLIPIIEKLIKKYYEDFKDIIR